MRTLRFLVLAAALLAGPALAQTTTVTPAPDIGNSSMYVKYKTQTPTSAITLPVQASACTVPGVGAAAGTNCTIVLAKTDISSWGRACVEVQSGAGLVDDILVEVSADGTAWSEWAPSTLDATPATSNRTMCWNMPWAFVRVEARSAAGSTLKAWLSLGRP